MKKAILLIKIFIVALLPAFLSGCDKMPDNGSLDGMWQIMSVAYNSNYSEADSTQAEAYTIITDTKKYKAYLSFQLDLAKLHWFDIYIDCPNTNIVLCRFARGKSELRFHKFYWDCVDHDIEITDEEATRLSPFGFHQTDETFKVIQLTHKSMILQSRYARRVLRKF